MDFKINTDINMSNINFANEKDDVEINTEDYLNRIVKHFYNDIEDVMKDFYSPSFKIDLTAFDHHWEMSLNKDDIGLRTWNIHFTNSDDATLLHVDEHTFDDREIDIIDSGFNTIINGVNDFIHTKVDELTHQTITTDYFMDTPSSINDDFNLTLTIGEPNNE